MASEEPLLHSVFLGGRTALSPLMPCRSSDFKPPLTRPNSAGHREDRYLSSRAQEPISFTVLRSTIFEIRYWMPTTGSPTASACQSQESGRMTSAGHSTVLF